MNSFIIESDFAGEKVMFDISRSVEIIYVNYRGERAIRHILPENMYWGSSEYHPEPQYLLKAYDLDRQAYRDFAMKDISSWKNPQISSQPVTLADIL
jgi:predicted DNA-binding transcriptional regulator YafY